MNYLNKDKCLILVICSVMLLIPALFAETTTVGNITVSNKLSQTEYGVTNSFSGDVNHSETVRLFPHGDLSMGSYTYGDKPCDVAVSSLAASSLTTNSATLNGLLSSVAYGEGSVWLYWGTNDAGTVKGNWQNTEAFGSQQAGPLATNVTGLTMDINYYYRHYASNGMGMAWADSTASFILTVLDMELDYMEYASDGAAQSAYVSSDAGTVWDVSDAIAQFKLNDDAASTVVIDSSASNNNGTASDNSADLNAVGKVNDCFDFDGSSEFVNINTVLDDLSSATVGTICFWVNPDNVSEDGYPMIGFGDASSSSFINIQQDASNGKLATFCRSSGHNKYEVRTDDVVLINGTWTHVMVVHDGTAPYFYVNNVLVDITFMKDNDKTYWFSDYSGNLDRARLACRNYGGSGNERYWNGQLDDVRIFDRLLTSAERSKIYNSGAGRESQAGPNLQAYSESTIKAEGSYSLKGEALVTDSLNATLTRTVSPTIDLSGLDKLLFDIRSTRTGGNIKLGLHDSGGTTTEVTYTQVGAGAFETSTNDISGVSDVNKDAIDSIIITIENADAENTFYIDNIYGTD